MKTRKVQHFKVILQLTFDFLCLKRCIIDLFQLTQFTIEIFSVTDMSRPLEWDGDIDDWISGSTNTDHLLVSQQRPQLDVAASRQHFSPLISYNVSKMKTWLVSAGVYHHKDEQKNTP